MTDVFVDTNVIAYRFDPSEPAKAARATEILDGPERLVISTQVMLELHSVLTRKLTPPVSPDVALEVLSELSRLTVVPADAELVRRAARRVRHEQVSIWDAMIIEAALQAGCTQLWTEDLAAGHRSDGLLVVNPFDWPRAGP